MNLTNERFFFCVGTQMHGELSLGEETFLAERAGELFVAEMQRVHVSFKAV
jgi:hypothetical protein